MALTCDQHHLTQLDSLNPKHTTLQISSKPNNVRFQHLTYLHWLGMDLAMALGIFIDSSMMDQVPADHTH